jgi:hypothetical protein
MTLRIALAAPFLAASAACHAGPTNAEMRAMFGFRVSMVCLAQDAAYEQSAIGHMISSSPGFKDWSAFEAHPLVHCLRERKFIDKPLCDDLMATVGTEPASGSSTEAINAAMDRHAAVLESADQVLYIEDAARKSPETFTCPAAVPDEPKKAP